MGWVASIVNRTQDLPLPKAWKTRLNHRQSQHASTEAERDALLVKIDILTAKNNELMQVANLDPVQQASQLLPQEVEILEKVATEIEFSAREIAEAFDINLPRAQYHLKRLLKHGYLVDFTALGYHAYLLDRRGREYLLENKLTQPFE
jgi:DNA-binding transcriptional ArsR family regulator